MNYNVLGKVLNYLNPPADVECHSAEVIEHFEEVKQEWREPVKSLISSIERGEWYIYSSWGSIGRTCVSTYMLTHTLLDIQFSIKHEAMCIYGSSAPVNYYYGEEWLSKSERVAVYDAVAAFHTALNKAFSDARNKVREQEFMQLIKEK